MPEEDREVLGFLNPDVDSDNENDDIVPERCFLMNLILL